MHPWPRRIAALARATDEAKIEGVAEIVVAPA